MRARLTTAAKRSRTVQRLGRTLDTAVPASERVCTVLTFHRIDTHEPDLYPGLAGLDGAAFAQFVDELVERWRPVAVSELLAALSGEHRLPERSVVVTFDDAYRDFADVAWPVLQARQVPVVLFVPTAYPDAPDRRFWWDELYAAVAATGPDAWHSAGLDGATTDQAFRSVRDRIQSTPHGEAMRDVRELVDRLGATPADSSTVESERVLGWDELRTLASEGVTLAPHSRTHPMLDQLQPDELDPEVRGSLDDMHQRLGSDLVAPVFAYPAGGHDPRVRDAVRRAGYEAAFTTERGLVDIRHSDRFRLPRLNVGRGSSLGVVAAEAAVRRLRRPTRDAARERLG